MRMALHSNNNESGIQNNWKTFKNLYYKLFFFCKKRTKEEFFQSMKWNLLPSLSFLSLLYTTATLKISLLSCSRIPNVLQTSLTQLFITFINLSSFSFLNFFWDSIIWQIKYYLTTKKTARAYGVSSSLFSLIEFF